MKSLWIESLLFLADADDSDKDFGTLIFALVIAGVLSLVGLVIFIRIRLQKKRTEGFRQVAEQLGLPFFPKGDDSLLERLGSFHLFSRGHSKKIKNMLHGETGSLEVAIFDYWYTTGHGKHRHTHGQSVVYFSCTALSLPRFALRPEGLFHKIGSVLGYQDIDFESHPRFSKTYLLRGEDEAQVRELFNDELLTFFETEHKLCVEGGGDQLVFYRGSKRIKPDEVQQFMDEGVRVFTAFGGPA